MAKNEMKNDNGMKVYEIGYLLVPTIAEENLPQEVQAIKASIESRQGTFITEDFPTLRPLAYEMVKVVGSKRSKYSEAYFGWIKFEATSHAIPLIKEDLDKMETLIRFMTINTVRENTMVAQKVLFKPTDAPEGVEGEAKDDAEAPKVEGEDIDKTIDNLVV
ncbi:MAG: 30S ribosomal protein S6 [Patescibacteria group bacterium]